MRIGYCLGRFSSGIAGMIDYPTWVALEIYFFHPYDTQAASTTETACCLWIDVGIGAPLRRYTCK